MAFGSSGKRIAGITIELGADTTKLTTALKGLDKELNASKTNLKDINNLLKLNPGNVTLLAQKQKELQSSITKTKDRLSELKSVSKDSTTPEQWDALQREIIDTETQLKSLEKEYKNFGSVAVQQVKAAGEKMQQVGAKLTDVGKTLTQKVTAPIVAGFGAALKVTFDFDSQMSKVNAISGATGDEVQQLRDKAREMGAATKFSATEAGEAFEYMAMAGWKTEDMLGGIEGIMSLAAASGEELGTTSDIVTDALTAFGEGADRAGDFADVLAQASSNANTNVGMMGETFKYVAPVAGSLGYNYRDVALAVGLMANNGIKASQAGTSLRGLFTRLAKPTKESATAMSALGISMTDANGSMKPLRQLLQEMREKFAGLTESEKAQYAAMLAGQNGMSGLLAIVNSSEKDFDKLADSVDNSTGAAKRMADQMQDNLAGQLTILKSQLEELAISVGEVLMPYARKLVGVVQKFVGWINKLSPKVKTIVVLIGSVAAAIGPLLVGVGGIISLGGKALSALAPVLPAIKGGLATITGLLTGPAGIVIGVGAVIAVVLKVTGVWDKLKASLIDAWPSIKQGAVDAWEAIKAGALVAWDLLKAKFGEFKAFVNDNFIAPLQRLYEASIKPVFDQIAEAFEPVKKSAAATWNVIQGIFNGWNSFGDLKILLGDLWENLTAFGAKVGSILAGVDWAGIGRQALEIFKSGFKVAGDWIKGLVLGDDFTPDSTWADVGGKIWSTIQTGISAVGDWIKGLVLGDEYTPDSTWAQVGGKIWDSVKAGFAVIGDWIKGLVLGDEYTPDSTWGDVGGKIWGAVTAGFTAAGDWIKGIVLGDEYTPDSTWAQVGGKIWSTIVSGMSAAVEWLSTLFTSWTTKLTDGSVDFSAIGASMWTAITSAFSGAVTWFTNLFGGTSDTDTKSVKGAVASIDWAGLGSSILGLIGGAFSGIVDFYKGYFIEVWNNVNGLNWAGLGRNMWSAIKGVFLDVHTWLKDKFVEAWNNITNLNWSGLGRNILRGIKDGLKALKDWFVGLFDLSNVHIPLPHITWQGEWSWNFGQWPTAPTPSISWYRKAYDNPVMFTRPTVVNTPYGPKGFGDGNGGEVVLSEARLRQMTGGTVNNNITINQLPGESSEQLAERVQRVLVRWDRQRKAVYGV